MTGHKSNSLLRLKEAALFSRLSSAKLDNGYEIIAGERRWRAAQAAGLKDVPIVIREATDMQAAEMSLIENIQREELNPLEEADAYVTLIETFKLSQEEISSRVRQRSLDHRQYHPSFEIAGQSKSGFDRKKDFFRSCPLFIGMQFHGRTN